MTIVTRIEIDRRDENWGGGPSLDACTDSILPSGRTFQNEVDIVLHLLKLFEMGKTCMTIGTY